PRCSPAPSSSVRAVATCGSRTPSTRPARAAPRSAASTGSGWTPRPPPARSCGPSGSPDTGPPPRPRNRPRHNRAVTPALLDRSGIPQAGRVVVKIGSSSLTGADGRLDLERVRWLAALIAERRAAGQEVVLVSSGAI